jgi:tRNA 2-selenouridine synthase
MSPIAQFTRQPWQQTYSEIIDVRSPREFATDHLPGAINLPVLNDTERAEVGTIYQQDSPFAARKVGAALIASNLSQHLRVHFAQQPKTYHPLIYCWRGGQRSLSMALVLTQVGWPVTLLEGGYETYRAYVRVQLEQLPSQLTYRLLCGLTGTAKTQVLQGLKPQAQILDLEDLANHRGSLLGDWELGTQPTQKYFETLLLKALQALEPSRPVWVEAESNKIGQIYVPRSLFRQMQQAPGIEVQAPLDCRVHWLLQEYPHLRANPSDLKHKLQGLTRRYGQAQIQQWSVCIDQGQWPELVQSLLELHYDPAYRRSLRQKYPHVQQVYALSDLTPASLQQFQSDLLKIP